MADRGRKYEPTDEDRVFVERSVMAGSRINDIADCLNITDDTLRKHFRYEIVTARERLKGDAVRVLMDSLNDGSLDAAKYVLSRVAGWTETQAHVGGDGPPIRVESTSARDALAQQLALMSQRSGQGDGSGGSDGDAS